MIRSNASPAQQQRQAMHNANAFKVGLFGANLSGARTATTVPDRWSASWPDCLTMARIADEGGIDFLLPVGRWKGYGGEAPLPGATLQTNPLAPPPPSATPPATPVRPGPSAPFLPAIPPH